MATSTSGNRACHQDINKTAPEPLLGGASAQPEIVEAEVDDRGEGGAVVGWIRKAIAKARGEQ